MALKTLTLKDKNLFNEFLSLDKHELSVYAFENIYLWKALFEIYWIIAKDSLCIFFKDKIGSFLYLPPLGSQAKSEAVEEVFRVMDKENENKSISRIENIEEKGLPFYKNLGLLCTEKYPEYFCRRKDLTELKGHKFKSKRASCNYFRKNYQFEYLPFSQEDKKDCLRLYHRWMQERKFVNPDAVYQGMLSDGGLCLQALLDDYKKLNFLGRIVKIKGKIKAFTFGFKLNPDTFCISQEVTDLSVKGLPQFIFREFCRELKEFKYINIMDDSGLENLKKVKLSYRPAKLIPAYIATRQ